MDLNNNKRNNSFTTPDGYFEKLNQGIKELTCNQASVRKSKSIALPRVARIMSYAATIAIVAFVATYFIPTKHKNSPDYLAIEMLNDSEYIDNMLTIYPIDEYTFYSYLTGVE